MTWRGRVGLAAAGVHLTLVALGAAGVFHGLGGRPPERALRWYGSMTGADAGYSFFAQVGSETRIRFLLSNDKGREWEDTLTAGQNQEVRLRVGSMTGLFPADAAAVALRQDLAASWAAAMFGRHPDASSCRVLLEVYEVPSMAEYRDGNRTRWQEVFAATFFLTSKEMQ